VESRDLLDQMLRDCKYEPAIQSFPGEVMMFSRTERAGMSKLLKWLTVIWTVLYLLALLLFAVGHFGLFGSEQGPLAGVFIVPLGLPWIRFVDAFPEPLWPWLAAGSPLLNIMLLYGLYRYSRSG
jgi:hypothetical protein